MLKSTRNPAKHLEDSLIEVLRKKIVESSEGIHRKQMKISRKAQGMFLRTSSRDFQKTSVTLLEIMGKIPRKEFFFQQLNFLNSRKNSLGKHEQKKSIPRKTE